MIVVVAALKGGVGKTTTAVYLAALVAASRRSATLIDADPQASSTDWVENAADQDLHPGLPGGRRRMDGGRGTGLGHHSRASLDRVRARGMALGRRPRGVSRGVAQGPPLRSRRLTNYRMLGGNGRSGARFSPEFG